MHAVGMPYFEATIGVSNNILHLRHKKYYLIISTNIKPLPGS